MSQSLVRREAGATLTGRQVLGILLGFFGSIFAVNGWFVYDALSTYSGEVDKGGYQQGIAYNDRIAAESRQAELGWHTGLDVAAAGTATLTLADAAGTPVTGRVVSLTVGRPATAAFDHTLTLGETAPGVYSGSLAGLTAGTWVADAAVKTTADSEPEYRLRRRVWLKP
jgi:nitrogen fixation protein FixH